MPDISNDTISTMVERFVATVHCYLDPIRDRIDGSHRVEIDHIDDKLYRFEHVLITEENIYYRLSLEGTAPILAWMCRCSYAMEQYGVEL